MCTTADAVLRNVFQRLVAELKGFSAVVTENVCDGQTIVAIVTTREPARRQEGVLGAFRACVSCAPGAPWSAFQQSTDACPGAADNETLASKRRMIGATSEGLERRAGTYSG
jgi:hypothetical protein